MLVCCVAVCVALAERIHVSARTFAEACLPRVALIETVDLSWDSPDV